MRGIAAKIIYSYGWRRCLIAFGAGAVGALAMAPFNFFPALIAATAPAVWLIDGCAAGPLRPVRPWRRLGLPLPLWRAFGAGWWWGFGYFVAGLWWLGAAFLVDAKEFAWALPLGVFGLPAVLALFPALGFLLAWLLWSEGCGRFFALAAGLGLAEWLRGHVLTGFPWNNPGMALGGTLETAQIASVIGLYGLTVAAILIASAFAALGEKPLAPGAFRRIPLPAAAAALAFAGIWAFGALRLAASPPASVPGVKLRIMQPDVAQDDKFRPENQEQILAHYLSLSLRGPDGGKPGLEGITALIWPESAFPFILSRSAWARAEIGAALPPGTVLVTGAARAEPPPPGKERPRFFNAIQIVSRGGWILGSYDKVHLVPFGEYLPYQGFFERLGLRQFVHIPGGFEPGPGRQILSVPGLPAAAPLICYEAIFPGEALPPQAAPERPGLLLNVTNDGWFGMTSGPYQHFAQARLRAIEEGLPLVRAANSGISAIADPYGRLWGSLPLGAEGVLDGGLPKSLAPTVYARWPFMTSSFLWVMTLAAAALWRFRP